MLIWVKAVMFSRFDLLSKLEKEYSVCSYLHLMNRILYLKFMYRFLMSSFNNNDLKSA